MARPRWLPFFYAVVAVVVVAASVKYAAKATKPDRFGEQTRSAFLRWRGQIQAMEDGQNVYRTHNYPNPPVMAMLLWPFTELPPLTGAMTWYFLKAAMTVLAFAWVFGIVADPGRPFAPAAKALTVVLAAHPVLGDLSHGNVNLFILFLIVGSLYAFHRGRDFLAGGLLALAIACKVTPALFVFYFGWKRAWRCLAGCAVGLAAFLVVVPGLLLGFEWNLELLRSWFDGMVRPFLIDGKVTSEHPNQSLTGFLYRMLAAEPSFLEYVDDKPVPAGFHNVADLGVDTVRIVSKACMAAFALVIVGTCRAPIFPAEARRGWRIGAESSLIVLGMLLFSERTWKHHGVTLVLPFAVLAYLLWDRDVNRRVRNGLIAALTATAVLTFVSSAAPTEYARDLTLVYGAFTGAYLVLAAAVVAALRAGPASAQATRRNFSVGRTTGDAAAA